MTKQTISAVQRAGLMDRPQNRLSVRCWTVTTGLQSLLHRVHIGDSANCPFICCVPTGIFSQNQTPGGGWTIPLRSGRLLRGNHIFGILRMPYLAEKRCRRLCGL